MKSLPSQPETPNVRVLGQELIEEFTGLTTADVTLAEQPLETLGGAALLLVFKNGTLVRPSTYTVSGKTVTLDADLIEADWLVARYSYRT